MRSFIPRNAGTAIAAIMENMIIMVINEPALLAKVRGIKKAKIKAKMLRVGKSGS